MKEFFGGSSPKDIFQAKLNSVMVKPNSDNPMGMKRNTQKNTCSVEKRRKTLFAKKKKKRKRYIMGYEYALLEKQGIDTLSAHGVENTTQITDGHTAQKDQAMILLHFFQQRGVTFSNQAFTLSAVG